MTRDATGRNEQHESGHQLADLLERCAGGDQAAFEELYEATASRVFGLVLRVVVQHALAEEVTQDVLTYVWTQAGRFDRSKGSATSWLMTIAHRRAVDRVRSAQSTRTRDDVWHRKVTLAPFDSTAETANASLEAQQVHAALKALTFKQRTAIQLAYFHGLTYTEVAAHLGIPTPTAKTRIRDGLRALAVALQPAYGQ